MKTEQQGVDFRSGDDPTVQIDYVNENRQHCCGTLGVPGADNSAKAYKMECTLCGFVYGANGADVHERKCPNCQGGAAGIRFWLVPRKFYGHASAINGSGEPVRVELVADETAADWLDRISGTFKDDPEYDKFMELCAEFRRTEGNRSSVSP